MIPYYPGLLHEEKLLFASSIDFIEVLVFYVQNKAACLVTVKTVCATSSVLKTLPW